ncbi:MAG: amidase domain-containing protein [Defluviitaleaceae bacterium]|nr:amidase domain-containing protein [Defluviitaleaceae bacterium]
MYNREEAVNYARKWALSRNPKFYNFDNIGGNCTNFISQCIYAGAGTMNFTKDTGWYYTNQTNRAAAWTSVNYLHKFLTTNKEKGPYGKELHIDKHTNGASKIEKGDIIQLSFDGVKFSHSLFITSSWPCILIATNSKDALDKPLREYEYKKARAIKILGVN